MTLKIPSTWLLLIALLSFSLVAGAFYLILSRGASDSVTQQLMLRKQVYARANAANIGTFFDSIGKSVTLRAQLDAVERGDETTVERLDDFVGEWGDNGIVSGIILTDSKGIVTFNSGVSGIRDEGADVSDRDYFVWAKNQQAEGEYFVGQPVVSRLGDSEGKIVVPVASPVFKDGIFWGVLVSAVKLEPLTERFLNLMKISGQTDVYLVDNNKEILYSTPNSSLFSSDMKKKLTIGQEGQFQEQSRLVVYSPISLGEQGWLVIVAAPTKEVFSLAVPFYVRHAAILILTALITFIFGIIINRESSRPL
jgi:hypothetical protein